MAEKRVEKEFPTIVTRDCCNPRGMFESIFLNMLHNKALSKQMSTGLPSKLKMSYSPIMRKNKLIKSNELSEQLHFDLMAKKYDSNYTYDTPFTQYKIQKKLNFLFKKVGKNKKLKILEIGAGTGEYTQQLAQLFPKSEIVAIDISPKILKVAKEKCKKFDNVSFKVASVYDLPYKKDHFDIVCGFYILHHVDLKTSLKEIYRVLKTKGLAIFYEPNILNPLVFIIKNNSWLKKKVGDSPEEKAINPLNFGKKSSLFSKYSWSTSEFIFNSNTIPLGLAIFIDKATFFLSFVPGINLLGGSVAIKLIK